MHETLDLTPSPTETGYGDIGRSSQEDKKVQGHSLLHEEKDQPRLHDTLFEKEYYSDKEYTEPQRFPTRFTS